MDDLIRRSALLEKSMSAGLCDAFGDFYGCADVVLVDDIEAAPVVDAVRVQHRQWDRRRVFSTDVICSGCGTLQTTKDSQYKSRFCPGCGAKMDGERETNDI